MDFKKLNAEDIVLKSPGIQIKEKIIESYGSIEEFSKKMNLYPVSVNQYLYSKNLGSNSFKVKLTIGLNEDFHNLYKSEEEQIKEYVHNLINNIYKYNRKSDVQLIEKLKKICFEREMLYEYTSVCRVYGLYYYNMNKIDRAIAYMDLVINYLKKKEGQPRLILTMSELGLSLCGSNDIERLNSLIKYMRKRLEKSDEDYIYDIHKVYYNLGIIYNHLGRFDNALEMFQESLSRAESEAWKVKALIAIGDHYKNQNNYNKAKDFYYQAKQTIGDNENIYENNLLDSCLAELFYKINEPETAETYIENVFNRIEGDITYNRNDYLLTYARIKIKLSKTNEILNKIKKIIDEESKEYIYFLHHIDLIGDIIDYTQDNKEFLKELKKILIKSVKLQRAKDTDVLNRIKRHIGDIMTKL